MEKENNSQNILITFLLKSSTDWLKKKIITENKFTLLKIFHFYQKKKMLTNILMEENILICIFILLRA